MSKTVEFASLTIRSTNGMELEDYLDGIVIPAFFQADVQHHQRSNYAYSLSHMNLFKAVIKEVDLYFICGRFVRSETISREKRMVGSRLVNSTGNFDLATTSIFVLCLNNHRIVYAQETEKNPGLDEFGKFIKRSIRRKWNEYQDQIYNLRVQQKLDGIIGKKTTRNELKAEYPNPEVDLIPIASDENIRSFLDRFSKLQSASIEYILPNQDWDDGDLDRAIREKAEEAASQKTKLSFTNKDGLNIEPIAQQIMVAEDANTEIRLSGKDKLGDVLRGNNEDFKFTIKIQQLSSSLSIASVSLYSKLLDYVDSGVIKVQGILRKSEYLDDWYSRRGKNLTKQEEVIPDERRDESQNDSSPT